MRLPIFWLSLFIALSVTAAPTPPVKLTLPKVWYSVPGVPNALYYDNVVLSEKPEVLRFEITCDVGVHEPRRWAVNATEKDVGDHPMTVVIKDAGGKVLDQGRTVLRISPKNSGADRTLKILIVGDSLTAATAYPNEMARLLSEPGNPQWKMLSDHKPQGAKPGVAHEGYGGWTWNSFLTKYVAKPDPAKRSFSSPFVYLDAGGKAGIDLPRYFREHCGGETPDVVTFLLGINDCFHVKADDVAAVDKTIDSALENASKLLAAFHAAVPNAVLAVGLTTPPNSRESGFEANYHGQYHRWGWKQIQHRLVGRMFERFDDGRVPGVVLVPTEINLDPVAGYPDNNGVHPNGVGYAQIGVSFYSWMKAWLATVGQAGK